MQMELLALSGVHVFSMNRPCQVAAQRDGNSSYSAAELRSQEYTLVTPELGIVSADNFSHLVG